MSTQAGPCTKYLQPTHPEDEASANPAVVSKIASLSKNILDTYARPPFILEKGKGCWVWTTTGEKYLDFTAGIAVNALGHGDEAIAKIMAEQAATLMHTSNVFHNEWAGQLATLLVELTKKEGGLGWAPGSDKNPSDTAGAKIFISNSGTEANEAAFKFARKAGKESWARQVPPSQVEGGSAVEGRNWKDAPKTKFVCFENAFHGRSMGSLSATTNPKYQLPFGPLVPGFSVGKINDIEGMRRLIDEDTCGVIIEPIQGEGGVTAATEDFLRALRKRCDEVGALLIFDEIQCGLYRTGSLWAHGSLPVDCHPDMVTMAKPLANGFPIGAVMVRDNIAPAITVGSHGTTFGGSPLATRVGHHVLTRLSQPSFSSHIREVSGYLQKRLQAVTEYFPELLQPQVRGRGLILGLGFNDGENPGKLVKLARERGVLLLTAGNDAVRLVPSLIITKEEVDQVMDVVESCLTVLSGRG